MFETLLKDVRHAVRSLVRQPGFATVAVLTLALGLGASTAIFTVVNAVLVKPLPFRDSPRLARIVEAPPEGPVTPDRVPLPPSAAELIELRALSQTLSDVSGYEVFDLRLVGDEPMSLHAGRFEPETLAMLGARPVLGQLLTSADVDGIVLSYAAWQRYFRGATNVLGRVLTSAEGPGSASYRVVGVMAHGFTFPDPQSQAWTLFSLEDAARQGRYVTNITKLREGASAQAASAEIATLFSQIGKSRFRSAQTTFEVVTLQDQLVGPVRPTLRLLALVVSLVLLISCTNVANLFLVRATMRRREVALRLAIGAQRIRLARYMLTESLVVAFLGGGLGMLLAVLGVRLLHRMFTGLMPPFMIVQVGGTVPFPRLDELAIDGAAFAFAASLCGVAGIVAGLPSTFRYATEIDLDSLRHGALTEVAGFGLFRHNASRSLAVVSQVALATVLLVVGGLLLTSFMNLLNVRKGYDARGVVMFEVRSQQQMPAVERRQFGDSLVERLRTIPGVDGAAYTRWMPLVPRTSRTPLRTRPDETLPPPPEGVARKSGYYPEPRLVSGDYLAVMGTRLVEGRGLAHDTPGASERVLLINETLRRERFAGENPIGRLVYLGGDATPYLVIGVVEDVRQWGLDVKAEPQVIVSLHAWAESQQSPGYFVVRTRLDLAVLAPQVRNILRQLDSTAVAENIVTMEDVVSSALARPRMYAVVFGLFAVLGLTLAMIGVYGVMAYTVARGTRELAVRIALGAQPAEVLRMVLARAVILAGMGTLAGLLGATATARYLQGMLYELTPIDPRTFGLVAILVVSVAMLGSYIPARRAMRTDPLTALHTE